MEIGIVGLGKMGGNMVRRIIEKSDCKVFGYDRDDKIVSELAKHGMHATGSLKDMVEQMSTPRAIWIMLPAGEITENTLVELKGLLDRDDTIIDGGNSNWHDDIRHGNAFKEHGIHYVDVGVSGGVWGLQEGYCMMVGGPDAAVRRISPVLDALAPEDGWHHFGDTGAGHFVKMVHNGVEYGMMQAYAEGFSIMKASQFDIDMAEVAALWNRGSVVRSWLCELAERAFRSDGDDLAELQGWVEDSGEGRWTIKDGIDLGIPMPVLAASVYARFNSRGNGEYANKVLAALRNQFGGHAVKKV